MLVKKFIAILILVLSVCVLINTFLFMNYSQWFLYLYRSPTFNTFDVFTDSLNYVSSILSTTGDNSIIPITNEAKIWTTIIQLVPYILVPIFIAMTS